MLGIRTLEGLGLRGYVLTSAASPVLPYWMETLSVEGIPGRRGKASVVAKGDDARVLTTKQVYEHFCHAGENRITTVSRQFSPNYDSRAGRCSEHTAEKSPRLGTRPST
jgi:hypothetical protein